MDDNGDSYEWVIWTLIGIMFFFGCGGCQLIISITSH